MVQRDRRKTNYLQDTIIPGVVVAAVIWLATSFMFVRDSVKSHDKDIVEMKEIDRNLAKRVLANERANQSQGSDLEHFKAQCHLLSEKVNGISVMRRDIDECKKDIESIQGNR
jgi:hypothetical protein